MSEQYKELFQAHRATLITLREQLEKASPDDSDTRETLQTANATIQKVKADFKAFNLLYLGYYPKAKKEKAGAKEKATD